jgi:hypothetical protein
MSRETFCNNQMSEGRDEFCRKAADSFDALLLHHWNGLPVPKVSFVSVCLQNGFLY